MKGNPIHCCRILTGSLAVLLLPATASTQDITFTRDDFGSYAGARAIVAGDFDRNGWPDLALANAGRNTVTISSMTAAARCAVPSTVP